MSKKLKTLKDIEYISEQKFGYQVDVDVKILRQTARKWIKELEYRKKEMGYTECIVVHYESQICWIKHFFNLGDEK